MLDWPGFILDSPLPPFFFLSPDLDYMQCLLCVDCVCYLETGFHEGRLAGLDIYKIICIYNKEVSNFAL